MSFDTDERDAITDTLGPLSGYLIEATVLLQRVTPTTASLVRAGWLLGEVKKGAAKAVTQLQAAVQD